MLKIVSPEIVHKSEAAGVVFVPEGLGHRAARVERLIARQSRHTPRIAGVLVVEFVERARAGLRQGAVRRRPGDARVRPGHRRGPGRR